MKLFECLGCGQPLYFENTVCESCGRRLGFLHDDGVLSALEPAQRRDGVDAWLALAAPERQYRFCCNAAHDACNWLVQAESDGAAIDPEPYCVACEHNRTVPDLSVPANMANWRRIESAKHRMFHGLLRLGLPHETRDEDEEYGLAFDFLADPPDKSAPRIITGHDNGLITINLAEADDAARERIRVAMHEPYRTLLGHFRHEIGHYYWERLVRRAGDNSDVMNGFRTLFGDERQDYGEALQRHYSVGPAAGWQDGYVSAYASMHPWEDFAETWAHYMHIIDTLETAAAFGLRVKPRISRGEELGVRIDFDPYHADSIEQLIEAFLPVTFAVNTLNRSMGQPDLYPFVLSPATIGKLGYVHQLCRAARDAEPSGQSVPQMAPVLQASQPQLAVSSDDDVPEQTAALLTVAAQLALDPAA
ncbi:MAG: putative zinc-binding peptidase [Ferrovibrio sp.]